MSGATRLANSNYGGPHLIQNLFGVFGAYSIDGALFNREQRHQMHSNLTEGLGILAATDALVILYDPLGETWAPQLNITSDRKPG
jgi:hypothetical protein